MYYHKKRNTCRRYIWKLKINEENGQFLVGYGYCYGEKLSLHFNKRKGSARYQGRQSFKHQPKKFMHIGWYAEYMKSNWYEMYGRQRRKWCKRNNFIKKSEYQWCR